jgi:hypothetical protein
LRIAVDGSVFDHFIQSRLQDGKNHSIHLCDRGRQHPGSVVSCRIPQSPHESTTVVSSLFQPARHFNLSIDLASANHRTIYLIRVDPEKGSFGMDANQAANNAWPSNDYM